MIRDILGHWSGSNHILRWDKPEQEWEPWARRHGWLREDAPATGVCCPECQDYYQLNFTRTDDGQLVHFLPCLQCGLLQVDSNLLRRWCWHHDSIITTVSSLFCPGTKPVELVSQQAWVLGRITLPGSRPQLILLRSVEVAQQDAVKRWLSTNASIVAVFPRLEDSISWIGPSLQLAEVVTSEDEELRLRDEWHLCISGNKPGPVLKAKPRQRRDIRRQNIEKISNYLIEFLRRRREHALAAFQNGKGTDILPCPLQTDICTATGLAPSVVSKCLNDKEAEALLAVWKVCQSLDVNDCYRFRPPKTSLSSINRYQDDIIESITE